MSEARLEVQQVQRLSMSVQTALRLLSLNMDDLSNEIQRAIQENPALEFVPARKSATDYALQMKSRCRGRHIETTDANLASTVNLELEELELQLAVSELDTPTRCVAQRMLHMLSPKGYFLQPMEEFCQESGVQMKRAMAALHAIQMLEPAGVGARNLQECLKLQLRRIPGADALCFSLVDQYLPEIGKGNVRFIAKAVEVPVARVQRCIDVIRGLTPAPCALYEEQEQYIMPEFSVEAGEETQLTILFHHDYYPTLRTDANFQSLADTLSGEEKIFARKMLAQANQLIRAVQLRQSTMEKVAQIIVREQRAFFLDQYDLVPLRIDEAAREIGVHETTVYRAIQNKYLDCDRGILPLMYFFQREVADGTSAAQAKEMIGQICREHTKISDREIAELLEKRGVILSRRTVNKYRTQMDIESSFRRM